MVNTKINLALISKGNIEQKETYTDDIGEALEAVALFFAKHSDKEEYSSNCIATQEKIALFRQSFADAVRNAEQLTDSDIKDLLKEA